jgi:hypothetical protein
MNRLATSLAVIRYCPGSPSPLPCPEEMGICAKCTLTGTSLGGKYAGNLAGRGAAWVAHLNGVQGVGGSNPLVPTSFTDIAKFPVHALCIKDPVIP